MSVYLRPSSEMDVLSGLQEQHASLKSVFPKTAESKKDVKRTRRQIREKQKKIQSDQSNPKRNPKRKAEDGNMRVAVLKKKFSENLLSSLDLDLDQDNSNLQQSSKKKTPQDNPSGRRPLNSNHLNSKSLSALCRNCGTNSLRLTFLEERNSRMEEWKSMMEEKMRKLEMRLSKRRT